MKIPQAELADAHEKGAIFLWSLHALRFPYMHSPTTQLPKYMENFTDDYPIGVDLQTLEADFLDTNKGVLELAKALKNRYRGLGEIIGRNNFVIDGEEIHQFLYCSADETELQLTHPLPEGEDLGIILPDPTTLEYLHLTGIRKRSPALEAFVRQQVASRNAEESAA